MPKTITLSRRFFQQVGDKSTSELVDVLNNMDTTHRAELHDQIELSVARFDAKLEQRIGVLHAEVRADMAILGQTLRSEMREQTAELIKWMFLFWAGTALANLLLK